MVGYRLLLCGFDSGAYSRFEELEFLVASELEAGLVHFGVVLAPLASRLEGLQNYLSTAFPLINGDGYHLGLLRVLSPLRLNWKRRPFLVGAVYQASVKRHAIHRFT